MNILTELTVSLLFAQGLSNYLSVSFFIQNVLSVVRSSFIHSHSKNLKLESSCDTYSLCSAGAFSLPSGMEMWLPYEARRDTVTPSFQVRAGCLSVERASALLHSDWWMGRSEQSFKLSPAPVKGLRPTRSLSISHIILLVLAHLGQCFNQHKASQSRIKAKWMLRVVRTSLNLWQ